ALLVELPVYPDPLMPEYGRGSLRRRRRAHYWILDTELVQVRLVPRRVVVILLHFGPELRHGLLIEPDCRLVLRADERDVLRVLRLHVLEVVPRLVDELGMRQQIDDGQRDDFRSV